MTPPIVLATPSHQFPERPQDVMAVWVEDLTEHSFKLCLREVKIFDGLHRGIKIVSKMLYPPGVSEISCCAFAPHCTKQENRDTQGNNILIKPLHKGECDSKGLFFV